VVAVPALRGIKVAWSIEDPFESLVRSKSDERRMVLVGDAAALADERVKVAGHPCTVTVQVCNTSAPSTGAALIGSAYPALYDEATGVLLTLSVPDPVMPEKERGAQIGRRDGAWGHILPGLAVRSTEQGLNVSSLVPGSADSVLVPGVRLDDEGFVVPAAAVVSA
jgi:hypothetical protein